VAGFLSREDADLDGRVDPGPFQSEADFLGHATGDIDLGRSADALLRQVVLGYLWQQVGVGWEIGEDACLGSNKKDAAGAQARRQPGEDALGRQDAGPLDRVEGDVALHQRDQPVTEGALNREVGQFGDFAAARQREGEKLRAFLLERVSQIEALRTGVAPRIPGAIAAYEAKLRARLLDALGGEDERVHQEITLYASKIDVDEELSRLQTHLTEVQRVLAKGGAVGKRLDFLMQELHREANTLGSKSVDTEVSRAAMEIKILIEQMREQIQNIE